MHRLYNMKKSLNQNRFLNFFSAICTTNEQSGSSLSSYVSLKCPLNLSPKNATEILFLFYQWVLKTNFLGQVDVRLLDPSTIQNRGRPKFKCLKLSLKTSKWCINSAWSAKAHLMGFCSSAIVTFFSWVCQLLFWINNLSRRTHLEILAKN